MLKIKYPTFEVTRKISEFKGKREIGDTFTVIGCFDTDFKHCSINNGVRYRGFFNKDVIKGNKPVITTLNSYELEKQVCFPAFDSGVIVNIDGSHYTTLQTIVFESPIMNETREFIFLQNPSNNTRMIANTNDIILPYNDTFILEMNDFVAAKNEQDCNKNGVNNFSENITSCDYSEDIKGRKSRLIQELESEFYSDDNKKKIREIGKSLQLKQKKLSSRKEALIAELETINQDIVDTDTKFDELNDAYEFSNTEILDKILKNYFENEQPSKKY